MPIYEYQCDECGHRSEAIQRLADEPLTECGECGGHIRRLISAPAFQFKGSGWYVTDYAGRKGGDGSASEAKATATSSGDGKAAGDKAAGDKPASDKPSAAAAKGSE